MVVVVVVLVVVEHGPHIVIPIDRSICYVISINRCSIGVGVTDPLGKAICPHS